MIEELEGLVQTQPLVQTVEVLLLIKYALQGYIKQKLKVELDEDHLRTLIRYSRQIKRPIKS